MEKFVADGVLNPASNPTSVSVTRVFVGWILGDGLPWTTGESINLARFLQHVQVTYGLPTDTTVRNQVAKIFIELKDAVIREFAVRLIITSFTVH